MGPSEGARREPSERLKVAVAGGALQGLEVTCLARKAGYETLLLDRRIDAPATGIAHEFVSLDLRDHGALTRALGSVDLVIPATEDIQALESLEAWCSTHGMPLAFDRGAYAVSSSKTASDALFRKLGIPTPDPWPNCTFPVLAKPDGGSGSRGIEIFDDPRSLEVRFGSSPPPGWVLQEYLKGPSFSLEVVGRPGAYAPLQITGLEMDGDHDCKRVMAPAGIPPHLAGTFEEMAVTLAEAVGLSGIMDVEAILHEGMLKILEIDARFPSQTPMAVYHSTGVNMVEVLGTVWSAEPGNRTVSGPALPYRSSILEHIRVRPGHLSVRGERIMAEAGPLHLEENFFGAQEALTNHAPGREDWVATLLVHGADLRDAQARRDRVIREIRTRYGLERYEDEYPAGLQEQGE
ncbi:MAG: 3-methylornithine--L-lysine ligase PylC [Longimicrobiales bacterium]